MVSFSRGVFASPGTDGKDGNATGRCATMAFADCGRSDGYAGPGSPNTNMLSAIIPNYNHAAYLPDALAGLLAQTRQADEIIVIDDASSDDSVAVATGVAE